MQIRYIQIRYIQFRVKITTRTSTCGSVQYKRNIQNRETQSKRVLGLIKNRHRLADHRKVTQ